MNFKIGRMTLRQLTFIPLGMRNPQIITIGLKDLNFNNSSKFKRKLAILHSYSSL